VLKINDKSTTTSVSALTARTQLGQILKRVEAKRERFLIGRRGQPQAVLLGIDDFLETFAPAPDWLEKSWKAAERGGTASLTMRQIDAEIAKVRERRKPSKNETLEKGTPALGK
jgi:prevent-host-death family protein